jgi:hypothetical protein
MNKPELDKHDIKAGYYVDTRFCDHCDDDTWHRCSDSGHERDSSWDYQECLKCKWYKFGLSAKYGPPL